ncbi:MAG: response regulator [Elusimicrobia bacterium]|nr:response regulator [Elusimicrobiota bacterium]
MLAQILIADDDPAFASLLQEYLEKKGHRVIVAYDGLEATLKAHEHKPHLILLDIQMPGAYGSTVYRNLQEDKETVSIPVLFISAMLTQEMMARIPSGPQVRFLKKPFPLSRLDELVKELLPMGGYVP